VRQAGEGREKLLLLRGKKKGRGKKRGIEGEARPGDGSSSARPSALRWGKGKKKKRGEGGEKRKRGGIGSIDLSIRLLRKKRRKGKKAQIGAPIPTRFG